VTYGFVIFFVAVAIAGLIVWAMILATGDQETPEPRPPLKDLSDDDA
jgi:hypothetical protein